MDRELEVIRDEMEGTRASLADKLGLLESQVRETVQGASDTVAATVEGVKDVVESVTDTVGSVTESLNVSKHVEKNPWVAMGAAVAVGLVASQVLGPHRSAPALPPPPSPTPSSPPAKSYATAAASTASDALSDAWKSATSSVQGLAVGTLMGLLRELAISVVPNEWKSELNHLVDDVTSQLGGKHVDTKNIMSFFDKPSEKGSDGKEPDDKAMSGLSSSGDAPGESHQSAEFGESRQPRRATRQYAANNLP